MRSLRTISILLISPIAIFLLLACDSSNKDKAPPREITIEEQALVEASNNFGLELFNEVITESDGGNLFISPLSVSMALGMTYNGARGTTEEGMREALSFGDQTKEQINKSYRSLIDLLTGMDKRVTLEIANSIWHNSGLSVQDGFISACETFFFAVVKALDFGDSVAAATINSWVSDQTSGKITEIVEEPIDPSVVMFLINAVYFKGGWANRFDKSKTYDAPFHLNAETDKTVKMMVLNRGSLSRADTEEFQAFNLAYGAGYFSMTILLPNEGIGVDQVAIALTPELWQSIAQNFRATDSVFKMPRFEMEFETSLVDVLSALGMEVAFDELNADFGGIAPDQQLYISEVKHKSWVHVDEEGTKAAAVTSISGPPSSDPFTVVVDRPFLFIIHDRHTGSLLFMGKVVDPPSA